MGLPELKFLLQPSKTTITMKRITTLLRPSFSEEGSNAFHYEKEVYSLLIKYLREVAGIFVDLFSLTEPKAQVSFKIV